MHQVVRRALTGVAAGLLIAVAQPVVAHADVAERCSGPRAGESGTYRTCIYASVDVVRARTYILTRACDSPTGCAYQANPRLYVELLRNGVKVNAAAITYPVGVQGRFEVVVYYPNERHSTDRYSSVGRATQGLSVSSPDIIV